MAVLVIFRATNTGLKKKYTLRVQFHLEGVNGCDLLGLKLFSGTWTSRDSTRPRHAHLKGILAQYSQLFFRV